MTSHSIREKGIAVRIYRRGSSPIWTASFRIDGQKIQRSTEEEGLDAAKGAARKMVADELRERLLDVEAGSDLTWGQLFRLYQRDRIPHMKKAWATSSTARAGMFESCFGTDTKVTDLDQSDVDRYAHLRTTGKLFSDGQNHERKKVSRGTVEAEVRWLNAAVRWAMRRKVAGERLLTFNPLDGLERPEKNKNPRRPITSEERYRKTIAKADKVDPKGRLRAQLALARYTGRRIAAICHLRVSDILMGVQDVEAALAERGADVRLAEHFPHGAIRWSEEHDKEGLGWLTPIAPELRKELELYRSRRKAIGDAPLFAGPRTADKPMRADLAGKWLRRAEKKAKLAPLAGGRWHPYRRLFATELAHVPAKVAAALGGWKDPQTMQSVYQQPGGSDLYSAALEVGRTG